MWACLIQFLKTVFWFLKTFKAENLFGYSVLKNLFLKTILTFKFCCFKKQNNLDVFSFSVLCFLIAILNKNYGEVELFINDIMVIFCNSLISTLKHVSTMLKTVFRKSLPNWYHFRFFSLKTVFRKSLPNWYHFKFFKK